MRISEPAIRGLATWREEKGERNALLDLNLACDNLRLRGTVDEVEDVLRMMGTSESDESERTMRGALEDHGLAFAGTCVDDLGFAGTWTDDLGFAAGTGMREPEDEVSVDWLRSWSFILSNTLIFFLTGSVGRKELLVVPFEPALCWNCWRGL